MYTEFNGRVWSSEEKYLEFKINVRKYFKASLALEDYADCESKDEIYNDKAFLLLNEYRKNEKNMNEQELLISTTKIVESFDKLFEKIGKEKFIFYDDGDVNYIWVNKNKED